MRARWPRPAASSSPPAEGRRDVGQNPFDDVRIVGHAQLIGYGQEQRISLGDGLVLPELFDEHIRFGGIAAAEDRARVLVDEPDLVRTLALVAEIGAIAVVQ